MKMMEQFQMFRLKEEIKMIRNTKNNMWTQFSRFYNDLKRQEYKHDSVKLARAIFTGRVY